MKKIFNIFVLLTFSVLTFASNKQAQEQDKVEKKVEKGAVISMNKAMFIENVFNFEKEKTWKYSGKTPIIIDLYADWCAPCRMIAPILKNLAKEYEGKVTVYKVNVDKEKEIAAFFNARSIPLVVFIPMKGDPQFITGAASKETYKKGIDSFLLK